MTTPLQLAVRGFVHELNRRRFERIEGAVLEAPTYWGVVELVRDRVPEAAEASREESREALHRYGSSSRPWAGDVSLIVTRKCV